MGKKKLIVIGGGAAGFFCAVNAARMNSELEVLIFEKSNKLLSKVSVSGGGRCNVTHACFDILEMSKKYPRGGNFVKKTFHQFFTTDTISWFEERGVKLKTEKDGRMFPVTDSSQTIINCLLNEAQQYGVKILMKTEVKTIVKEEHSFKLEISNDESLTADYVCIASGGFPKASMFEWLTKLGHSVEEPVPSLFTFNMPQHPITKLMGVSVPNATVRVIGAKLIQLGPLLITHWGLSGPAILKLSAWGARELADKNYDFTILINWLPEFNEQQLSEHFQKIRFEIAAQKISNKNPFYLPQRLWEFILESSSVKTDIRWADLPAKEQNKLIKNLCAAEFNVKGKTTFKEEFVTAGGIKLNEIDHNTMMSKVVPNIFFAGEILDVDGVTGGFNFQHAWTSGFVAAKAIAQTS
ncbi:MAG: NAD(P)/FAD-dependent oxidoreductase [Chitinophagaceae bacterium]|nr:NAD(P)/FAD-dependent oxidoreductase [Chitinophagaceae bacterium]MBK8606120.1 NAD(P)/FAD-dependent oxidoreductase [Chitinophagaceae bacterium]MBP6476361.1 NAD(P)/FAD-dependent oxidoreductase [Chitinophagaceae bacterium]MBP7106941.1 NAD(P)/FAD-dependent oxidoreductase [Chitinophagaceae bacterium]MBP7315894.1 NAD(P)/FAD-dependent oxidoreductase [Chitinophagaceae bacterium]